MRRWSETYPLIAGVVQPTAASADQPGLRRASPWATSDRSQRPPRSATIKPTQAHAKANQNRRDKRHDAGPGRCFRPGKPGIAPSMSNLFCHWRQLHARWRTAVGRRRSRHQGHLRLARRGFRSENGRRLGAAGRRRAFQVTKSWSKADIKVEVW
jgi:hypothetical protein